MQKSASHSHSKIQLDHKGHKFAGKVEYIDFPWATSAAMPAEVGATKNKTLLEANQKGSTPSSRPNEFAH